MLKKTYYFLKLFSSLNDVKLESFKDRWAFFCYTR
nr:MAG TPA: hypothetical protein [Caudoviricetes sp.]